MATIMLVDDNPVEHQVTRRALEAKGHLVEVAKDAWIAGQVQQLKPDLILMDVHLSSILTGPMAVESLRRADMGRHLKIYLYSSTERRELREMASGCGADGFICKGEIADIQEAVDRALN